MQWPLGEGSAFLFPNGLERGEKKGVALTAAQMATYLPPHLRAAGIDDNRCKMHFFRVGGPASHSMGGTAVDVLLEYVR